MNHTHGIVTVDTGFHRPSFDAAYLVVENNRGAFVDCGTQHSIPAMLPSFTPSRRSRSRNLYPTSPK